MDRNLRNLFFSKGPLIKKSRLRTLQRDFQLVFQFQKEGEITFFDSFSQNMNVIKSCILSNAGNFRTGVASPNGF